MLLAMAVSGSVPSRHPARLDPVRWASWVRRGTLVIGVVLGTWFFLKFGTRWVPRGMDTVPTIPPGSWCVVDRWSSGLRVGSDVFVDTPAGEMLSRVAELGADEVVLAHPNRDSRVPDSATFGPVPRQNVRATVVVVFEPAGASRGK